MTKFGILGAAALVASAIASPAMAQEVIYNPAKCAQYYPNANCQNLGPGNPYVNRYQRETYRDQSGIRPIGKTAAGTTATTAMTAGSGRPTSPPAWSGVR